MTDHLSLEEIAGYVEGRLPAHELLRVDDHLSACGECRQRARSDPTAPGVAAMRDIVRLDVMGGEHPGHEDIVAYVDGTLDPVDREILEAHLESCEVCAEDADDLRAVMRSPERLALQGQQARSARLSAGRRRAIRVPRIIWYAGAGLAAAAALAGVVMWKPGARVQPPAPVARSTPQPTAAASAVVLTLNDGDHTVTLDATGTIAGIPAVAPDDRDALVAALRGGAISIPPVIATLRQGRGTLLGSRGAPVALTLAGPIGTVVEGTRPRFQWTAQPGAASYVVSVFDLNLERVAQSEPLPATDWTPPSPLPRGRTYTWQIRARTANGEITAPAPPAPEARFAVLSQDDADRVAAWRRTYSGSPLTLGVLLARVGLLDEAQRHLEQVAAANPTSREAQQLARSVRLQADGR